MAKRLPFVVSIKELFKHLQSTTTPRIAIVSSSRVCFSTADQYVRGGDPVTGTTEVLESVGNAADEIVDTAWDTKQSTAQKVGDTITAEADTNVVDTLDYRSAEDLKGQLGDGCDNKV